MGRLNVGKGRDSAEIRAFTKAILRDLKALEEMLSRGMIESGIRRFGVEQEFFLVGPGLASPRLSPSMSSVTFRGGPSRPSWHSSTWRPTSSPSS